MRASLATESFGRADEKAADTGQKRIQSSGGCSITERR